MLYSTEKDLNLAKKIILEELKDLSKTVDDTKLDKIARDVLNTSYSIGGSYNEDTLRKIVKAMLERNILGV